MLLVGILIPVRIVPDVTTQYLLALTCTVLVWSMVVPDVTTHSTVSTDYHQQHQTSFVFRFFISGPFQSVSAQC